MDSFLKSIIRQDLQDHMDKRAFGLRDIPPQGGKNPTILRAGA
jgi:hypothetical protein